MKTIILSILLLVIAATSVSCMTKSVTQNVYISNSHNVTVSTEDSQAKPFTVDAEIPMSNL